MFFDPDPSPFDLSWRMFGVLVRVSVWFWILSLFLGWGTYRMGGVSYLAIWVGCVFLSILPHELGHVAAFRAFGVDAGVLLYGGGGLAIPTHEPPRASQRIIVALAGPGVQLALFGLIWALGPLFVPSLPPRWQQPVAVALAFLWWINLVWALFNLLPIWPLDGGRVSREVLQLISRTDGLLWSLYLSLALAGLLAVHGFLGERSPLAFLPVGGTFMAIFMAMLALQSWQLIQLEQARGYRWDDDRSWDR